MPNLETVSGTVYYETKGNGGETLAFLNGVAMSTEHWAQQVPYFSEHYRVLLHDFAGQGKSTLSSGPYSFSGHADDFAAVLDALEIERVHLAGVSYGAEVAMQFALSHPERVATLFLGTAVSESGALLKAMVSSWIEAAQTKNGRLLFSVMTPLVYSDRFISCHRDWLDKRGELFGRMVTAEWMDAFAGLCRNFLTLGITDQLNGIKAPTLVAGAADDLLKPLHYSRLIHQQIPGSELAIIDQAGHAAFFEQPESFNRLLHGFIMRYSR